MAFFSFHSLLVLPLCIILTHAATFEIRNRCTYTVWAGAIPGGGRRLDSGQEWVISAQPGDTPGRIWPRTGCDFDADGNGQCETGDCGGVLECKRFGQPPNTIAEYSLTQSGDFDYMDISLVEGFNVPMEFTAVSGCNKTIRCAADIVGECPIELKAPGGCNNPCTVFKTDEYCCTNSTKCSPTNFSRFFKDRCPDVYSYPRDDETSTFNCPTGANYRIVFCPDGRTPSALPTMAQIIVIF